MTLKYFHVDPPICWYSRYFVNIKIRLSSPHTIGVLSNVSFVPMTTIIIPRDPILKLRLSCRGFCSKWLSYILSTPPRFESCTTSNYIDWAMSHNYLMYRFYLGVNNELISCPHYMAQCLHSSLISLHLTVTPSGISKLYRFVQNSFLMSPLL